MAEDNILFKGFALRFKILAMRDEARETLEGEIEVEAYMLDLRLKWFL